MTVEAGRSSGLAVKKETTRGTLIPPAGTDYVPFIGDADIAQLRTVAESLIRVNSYSLTGLLSLRYGPGSFAIPFYILRTGVVDTIVPGVDTILENVWGRKTVNAGVNVTYNLYRLQDPLLNFSIFYSVGGVVLQCAGAFVNDFSSPFVATADEAAILRATASGEFYRLHWVGRTTITEDLTATNAGLTQFKVAAADLAPNDGTSTAANTVAGKYTIGAYVMVGALTTSHKITAINPTSGVVTVTPAFGSNQVSGSTVRGFMPTSALTGNAISSHLGLIKMATVDSPKMLSGTYHHVNPRRALVEEKNGSDYVQDDAWEERRVITLEDVRSYFDVDVTPKQDLEFALANQLTQKAFELNHGSATGNIFQINLPQAIITEPRVSGEGLIQLGRGVRAIATAALDDESNAVSK